MNSHEPYMHRCLQLAELGSGNVAPNPMVGAVLVYEGEIIGEGYHREYGKAHAEVNCMASVKPEHQQLIPKSTLYVSLEPCAHFGKTPPCADLVIDKKISRVMVGCRDPFSEVNGKGIEKLQAAGIEVEYGVLENACKELNKRFFTYHTKHRPYIVLKWAQTADQKIAHNSATRLKLSNAFSDRLVHKWRSEEMGILVGTNTAIKDNPQLNTRLWPGKNPIRIVTDMDLRLPAGLRIFDGTIPTIVFNKQKHSLPVDKQNAHLVSGVHFYKVTDGDNLVHQILNGIYRLGIQSVLVEGGLQLLQSFINEKLWDEARVITNENLLISEGLPAPQLTNALLHSSKSVFSDRISFFRNKN